MDKSKGFTLIELITVVAIFSIIAAAIFSILTASDRSWKISRNKLVEQSQARKALDYISWELRRSSPSWIINGSEYKVEIGQNQDWISFYTPQFNPEGEIESLNKVIYFRSTINAQYLKRIKAGQNSQIIAINLEDLRFRFLDPDNSRIEIYLKTKKGESAGFGLLTEVSLRNASTILEEDLDVQEAYIDE